MNHVTVGAGALTKRTPHNSSQTTQTATNQQHETQHAATDKQTIEQTRHNARSKTPHQKTRKPRNRTQQAQSRGIPSSPTPQRRHARKPHHPPNKGIARSRPARSNTGSGQTVDKREIPEYPQREHPPTRRDNHANTVQTRKREKPTPRPPEQRRGKHQQTGA